jgi:PAS domain S-box-containing protein
MKKQIENKQLDMPVDMETSHESVAKVVDQRFGQPTDNLLQELQLRHLKLEMQNEELLRTSKVLQASHDRYFQLYDVAPVCYITLTEDGVIEEVNQTCTALLGMGRETLINSLFTDYVLPEEAVRWQKHFHQAKQKEGKQGHEMMLRRADGAAFHAYLDCLSKQTGDVESRLHITFTDITECLQAKQALREMEIQHAHALDCAELATWYWNIHTGHVDYSGRWAEMRGYTLEEMATDIHVWENSIYPDDVTIVQSALNAHLAGKTPFFQVEYRIVGASKQIFWILERGTVIKRDSDGNPLLMAGIEMVITERKQTEEALRIAAAAFETQEGIIVTDSNKVILRINQAFSRITGFSAENAIGKTASFLRSGLHDEAFYQLIWKAIDCEGCWQGEIWDKHKNGEILPLWLTITAITGAQGDISHYVGSFMDISAHKQAEKILLDARLGLERQVAKNQSELQKIKEESAEVNTALNVLLKYRETDKANAQNGLSLEMEATVLPFLKKLKKLGADRHQNQLIDILETNLHQLVKSYGRSVSLHSNYQQLTHAEIQVASLIRQGMSTKQIATVLNMSSATISVHRKHIRQKLGLHGKTTNLEIYLMSLSE